MTHHEVASRQKPLSRRNIILGAAGTLALVGAGATWRVSRQPEAALAPWRINPVQPADIRQDSMRYAILAPSPHNLQPWLIRLDGENGVLLHCLPDKKLPETDPLDRQITIGLGCFAELAAIAARQRGFSVDIEPFPDGEPPDGRISPERPVARFVYNRMQVPDPDPLFAQILERRSAKVPYDLARRVPDVALEQLAGVVGGMKLDIKSNHGAMLRSATAAAPDRVAPLRDLIWRAIEIELVTPAKLKESIDVLRVGSGEIEASPDGIPLKGPLFEALSLLGAGSVRAQALDPQSTAFRSTLERYRATFAATPAFIWIASQGNGKRAAFNAGRAYVRQNLLATALGLSMHPVSQALQEYPEMAGAFSEARRLCDVRSGETLQMLARVGYASSVAPAPRWPLEAKLAR